MRLLIAIAVVVLGFVGACTIVPKQTHRSENSYDGTNQNSGTLALTSAGAVLTERAKLRYDALAEAWGTNFIVPVKPGDGLTRLPDGNWLLDPEHAVKFEQMNHWRRQGHP